jgi:hypothetical protein
MNSSLSKVVSGATFVFDIPCILLYKFLHLAGVGVLDLSQTRTGNRIGVGKQLTSILDGQEHGKASDTP